MYRTRIQGFTLIELLITVVIVGILAAVAIPSYNSQVRKSRRNDGVALAVAVEQAQERWRANNASYADQTTLTTAAPNGLGLSATSTSGYYTVNITAASGSTYSFTITAVSGKSQASDTGCTSITITVTNGAASTSTCWSS